MTLAALGVGLALAGLQAWMRQPGDLTAFLLPTWPRVIRWMIVYGALAAAAATLLIRTGRQLAAEEPHAAPLVNLAIAAAFGALVIVILNYFLRPFLIAPWSGVVWSCLSIAASAMLVATLMSVRPMLPSLQRPARDEPPRQRGPPRAPAHRRIPRDNHRHRRRTADVADARVAGDTGGPRVRTAGGLVLAARAARHAAQPAPRLR
jgi:hypothetical protein